ncbi:MAG: ABC transporter permease [Candidatus Hodarchaeota archaeon]
MLKYYIKMAFRILKKHKMYTLINIGGLAIGIAVTIPIILFVVNELSYDRFHENYNRIYRLVDYEGSRPNTATAAAYANWIQNKFPEVEKITRLDVNEGIIRYGKSYIQLNHIVFADNSVFEIFSFPIIQGYPNALEKTHAIVLTESTAKKLFGAVNPIGKIVQYENEFDFTVTGIAKDMLKNSSIQAEAFVSFISYKDVWDHHFNVMESEGHRCFETYLLMTQIHDKKVFNKKLNDGIKQRFDSNTDFRLEPFKAVYFDNKVEDDGIKHGNLKFVTIFIIISIVILIIAAINFINLTTARTSVRAKEVGINKVIGAHKHSLIIQFLGESILISVVALFIGFILAEIVIPIFNSIIGYELEMSSLYRPNLILLFILGTGILGILSGWFPALLFSGFNLNSVLKGENVKGAKGEFFRKILIIFQFTVTIVLVIITLIVTKQVGFVKQKDLGFDKECILNLNWNNDIGDHVDVFKHRLYQNPNIKKIAFSSVIPGYINSSIGLNKGGKHKTLQTFYADPDYAEVMDLKIIKGRDLSWDIKSDCYKYRDGAILLNETAVKYLELEDPLKFRIYGSEVVGVVKDFHFRSLHTPIQPLAIIGKDFEGWGIANIKISSDNISTTISYIKKAWQELCHEFPFEYHFLDDTFDRLYKSEESFSELISNFALFAIFIACLGLFGLATFTAERRTKEIGIRKVVGASVSNILILLTKDFTKLVILANLIAWPIAYYTMNKWLQNFAYRIDISCWMFGLAGGLAVLIALLTVSWQAIRAATANPVEALRYE